MKVLAGDIGGTKTLLSIVDFPAGAMGGQIVFERRYESGAYPSLLPMAQEFLKAAGNAVLPLDRACFGVAGPVTQHAGGTSVKVTNLPWQFDSDTLRSELNIAKLALINDFQAVGYGIEALGEAELQLLQAGQPQPSAPRLVIGPGTGLGTAIMVWRQDHYEVLASEGGHIDFAPLGTLQIQLLEYLTERFGHVAYERMVSGPGLVHIYEFLCVLNPETARSSLPQIAEAADQAAAISALALTGGDALAKQAVEIFIAVCGAYAGNLALISLPYGGLYIAGGIAPKLIDMFTSGAFMRAFLDKGRYSSLLRTVPINVVLNAKVGLMGAALVAKRL